MTLFEEIVSSINLLNEDSNRMHEDNIIRAIEKLRVMQIAYDDRKPRNGWRGTKGKNKRTIFPIVYGISKSGKRCLGAYQTFGSTKRGVPKWKLFIVDNIINSSVSSTSFKNRKEDLVDLGLNVSGDKRFSEIFAISPFCDGDIQVQKTDKPIDSTPISKNKIEPSANQKEPTVDTIPSAEKMGTPIDNKQPTPYTSSSIEAPETVPITKTQIEPKQNNNVVPNYYNFASDKPQYDINSDEWNREYEKAQSQLDAQGTAPITKNDIQDNELTRSFRDMTNRMNNLYKDEDEDEEI